MTPAYDIGDKAYIRESAAIGFLEAVVISGVVRGQFNNWLYTYRAGVSRPVPSQTYGDRRSLVTGASLYLDESELIAYPEALRLIEANLQASLDRIQALRANFPVTA